MMQVIADDPILGIAMVVVGLALAFCGTMVVVVGALFVRDKIYEQADGDR